MSVLPDTPPMPCAAALAALYTATDCLPGAAHRKIDRRLRGSVVREHALKIPALKRAGRIVLEDEIRNYPLVRSHENRAPARRHSPEVGDEIRARVLDWESRMSKVWNPASGGGAEIFEVERPSDVHAHCCSLHEAHARRVVFARRKRHVPADVQELELGRGIVVREAQLLSIAVVNIVRIHPADVIADKIHGLEDVYFGVHGRHER